ncbi:MAG: L-seryl-tRNA(Sec) selenium transferase [Candidatus Methylumidiphilus sp.]
MTETANPFARLPSVDSLLAHPDIASLKQCYGHSAVVASLRSSLAELRETLSSQPDLECDLGNLITDCRQRLTTQFKPSLQPVFNLTGTVLHTNLGRALLADEAVEAVLAVLANPCNLEYNLADARRGDRDDHIDGLIRELTGAQAATVVNNNAAAVFLLLNTLAMRKEVIVSRGELIEIGGAFRIPDIMSRAGAKLREVGTTNRTHLKDYAEAVGPRTTLIMKVHRSNYAIEGFTATVPEGQLAELAHDKGLPFVEDLGSGTLIDLSVHGLPKEPTPQQALAKGTDLVSFSGDKLLGGPQAGILVGSKELIGKLKRNPLKRALRVDKMTLAALEATLKLYRSPELLARQLPTLRLLIRTEEDIRSLAQRILPPMQAALINQAEISIESCRSQIGSGSLPVDRLPSVSLVIKPKGKGGGKALNRLAQAFRDLPIPVVGRLENGALRFDLRCLEDEAAFIGQLAMVGHGARQP